MKAWRRASFRRSAVDLVLGMLVFGPLFAVVVWALRGANDVTVEWTVVAFGYGWAWWAGRHQLRRELDAASKKEPST